VTHPVFYGGRAGEPPRSLRLENSAPLLLGAARLQTLQRRLTAGMWSQTDEPYLLLEVPDGELERWAPGFEVALDGYVEQVPNPYAVIERYDDMIVLVLQDQGFWVPVPFAHWPESGDCEVVVLARGRLPPDARARELAVDELVTTGQALFSTVEITTPDPLSGW
jgi:hypothetical protein